MLRIVLVQPGATEFDDQGRIKGTLDIPLSRNGTDQVARIVDELGGLEIEQIYASPCQSAQQTALALAQGREIRVRTLEKLRNLDHGLWQGKLIAEVKHTQPKVYRQWQEHPETVCPPQGETVESAQQRVREALLKVFKRHKRGVVALVVAAPLASLVRNHLEESELGDLWKAECDEGGWKLIEINWEEVGT